MSFVAVTILFVAIQVFPAVSAARSVLPRGAEHSKQENDQAGPYVIGNDKDRTKQQGEVRDFLWSHWQQHRTGQLKATWISKEGVSSNGTFVFEYDEHGVWSIGVTIDRPALKDSRDAHTEYRVYGLQRLRLPGANAAVADDAQLPGTAFLLILKDGDGKKKTQI